MQFLRVLVKVKVNSTVLASCLVDENVVEIVSQPLHANDSQSWNFMVDDVLPANLALNHIGSDDVHDVVAYVKQLYEIVKLLLNQVLLLLVQFLRNVLRKVQPNEFAS